MKITIFIWMHFSSTAIHSVFFIWNKSNPGLATYWQIISPRRHCLLIWHAWTALLQILERVPRLEKCVRLVSNCVYFCCVKKAQLTQISVFPKFQWFSMDDFSLSYEVIWDFWAIFDFCYSMKRWANSMISSMRKLMKRATYFRTPKYSF